MIKDPKSIVDMGFNTATMVAFTVEPYGAAVAAGISGAQALFDIFFPEPSVPMDPASMVPTNTDLTNALNKLKADLSDIMWTDFRSEHQSVVLTINDQVSAVWISTAGDRALDRLAKRGPRAIIKYSDPQFANWKKEYSAFGDPILAVPSTILTVINWIESNDAHKRETMGLYALTAGLWNLLCKLNIVWEYNVAHAEYEEDLDNFNTESSNFQAKHWQWAAAGKNGPEPVLGDAPIEPKFDNEFQNNSVFARAIHNNIARFIKYLEQIVNETDKDFFSRENSIKIRMAKIKITQTGSGRTAHYNYHDEQTGKTGTPTPYRSLAAAKMQVYANSIKLQMYDSMTDSLGLKNIDPDDIKVLKDTIAEWKKTQAKYAPV